MTNEEILTRLEHLFDSDQTVKTTRTGNSVTFMQDFTDTLTIARAFKNKKTFFHTVTLLDTGEYQTVDEIRSSTLGLDSGASSVQRGQLYRKGFLYAVGHDNLSGETGLIRNEWSTDDIKIPVREFMKKTGRNLKQPFWTGKKIAMMFGIGWGIVILIAIILLIVLL